MPLASGAVQLPFSHLSVRVPWHDLDWTGRVCEAPGANNACTVLKNVAQSKDSDAEEKRTGRSWTELEDADVPPCVFESGGFMRPTRFVKLRKHAYADRGKPPPSHRHFTETAHQMPAFSLEAVPYRWVMRSEVPKLGAAWGIGWEQSLEDRADELMKWESDWLQDHRNQLALLDSFFSAVQPGASLVFIYAKDVPLLEERTPGARILVGVARIERVDPPQEWSYEPGAECPLRSILWERGIHHSIRPAFADGFLLPYQALLRDPKLQGKDLSPFVAVVPTDHFDEFSYVTEHVGSDAAIAALLELERVVALLPGIADGPWSGVSKWLSDRLAETWHSRGPYPGIGSSLTAAGIERGALVAHRVLSSLGDAASNPWPVLDQALARGGLAGDLVGRVGRKCWARLAKEPKRLHLLRLLARFPLSVDQATRLFDPTVRSEAGITVSDDELLENPYQLYELDRGRLDSITLGTIDRGLFPSDASVVESLKEDQLPEPVEEASDDRRVRAAAVSVLESAKDEGHTLLDTESLRQRIGGLPLKPAFTITGPAWETAIEEFEPELLSVALAPTDEASESGTGWQLAALASAGSLIRKDAESRLAQGELDLAWDWRARIDEILVEAAGSEDAEEAARRSEKATALEVLAGSRLSVLVGPAGTGKTTMLKALCKHPDVAGGSVLLLAPTGKARVQLAQQVGAEARTLAQFLRPSGRWHHERGYRLAPGKPAEVGFRTVVVDEASMLTETMLAALLEGLGGVERLVLCGDHRQLPPIGAGRPFADLVQHLRGKGTGYAELTVRGRQRSEGGRRRDDVAFAQWFSVEGSEPGIDEAVARVLAGESDDTIDLHTWKDEDELCDKVVELLEEFGIPKGDPNALKRSLGATAEYKGRAVFEFGKGGAGAENWQLLSPVRYREGGVARLNRLVRQTWRHGDASAARRSFALPPH